MEETPPGDGILVRRKLGIEADAPVVLLYSRFFEFSQERLHRLFADIYRRVNGVRFLVVGTGRHGEEELLVAAAGQQGFRSALTMVGWVEPQDISDYLAAADVAVYPLDDTLVNRSKCPAKLTEIIRAGIPVIVDRVGQATEYVNEEVSGSLSDPTTVESMVDKIVVLLQNKTMSKSLGEKGRRYLLEQFSWHDYTERLYLFYMNCLHRKEGLDE